MKKKNLLLLSFMLLSVFYANAQNYDYPLDIQYQYPGDQKAGIVVDNATQTQFDQSATAVRTTWVANRPVDNWFFSIQGGVGQLMSEQTRYMDFFKDQIKPTVGLAFGKWFSPVWGLRISATAAELQGFASWQQDVDNIGNGMGSWYIGNNYENHLGIKSTDTYLSGEVNYTKDANGNLVVVGDDKARRQLIYDRFLKGGDHKTLTHDGETYQGYTYDITYIAASIDFLLNLKNLTMPYNPTAFFNPVVYAGIGGAHTFKDKDDDGNQTRSAVNNIMGKAGLQLNFRLGDRWDLFLDGHALFLPESFDRRIGDGNTFDLVGNYTLGLTYRFNFRHFIKAPFRDPAEIDHLNREINKLRNSQTGPVICPECPEIEYEDLTFLPTPVFFLINSSVVRDSQWDSVAKAAEYLLENPTKRIKITGYADKQTGTPAINKRLSEQRANAVADILVERFGIDPSRMDVSYLGDTYQPFAENDWNRVVIFVIPENFDFQYE